MNNLGKMELQQTKSLNGLMNPLSNPYTYSVTVICATFLACKLIEKAYTMRIKCRDMEIDIAPNQYQVVAC